jgi:hypothetical protein
MLVVDAFNRLAPPGVALLPVCFAELIDVTTHHRSPTSRKSGDATRWVRGLRVVGVRCVGAGGAGAGWPALFADTMLSGTMYIDPGRRAAGSCSPFRECRPR